MPRKIARWRAAWVLAVAACVLALPGCLTDGSIPVGGGPSRAALGGTVVDAGNPDKPLAGARITVQAPDGEVLHGRSDIQGKFEFDDVPVGSLSTTVAGAVGEEYRPTTVTVRTDPGARAYVCAALAPTPADEPAAVTVVPATVTLNVGEILHFEARITGGGTTQRIPTWVVEGGIGELVTAYGQFRATRPGVGTVRAVLGGASGSATVMVQERPGFRSPGAAAAP